LILSFHVDNVFDIETKVQLYLRVKGRLGTDLKVRVLVVTVTSFFPLLVNGLKGLESVDIALLELAATYRANNWLVFTKLRIPASRPFMFAGLKVGAVLAVIAALVVEMLGADSGLGFLLMVSIYRIDTEALFCITILSVILSLFIFTGVVLCERKLFPWVTETDQTSTIS
jgi:NitT/TauT family transport system permease protein